MTPESHEVMTADRAEPESVTSLLGSHQDDDRHDVTGPLFAAVRAKDPDEVRRILETSGVSKEELDHVNEDGHTCLGIACIGGSIQTVSLLLKFGADPNRSDFYGQPPLQYSTEYGHQEVVKLLIDNGVDVNYLEDRLSAIHVAACKGETEIARLLIHAKCDVNARNRKGVSPLHCAVANGHRAIVDLLLSAHARVNVKGQTTDRTPLFMAGETGDVEMVRMLLQNGAKLNLTDQFGMTPLNVVCNRNNSEIAQLFILAGARVNMADQSGNLPLHYASRSGDATVVKLLLQNESKVDVLNSHFESPLHLAIRMQHQDVITQLVNHGCSTNLSDSVNGVTPLFAAVSSYSDPEAFEQLLLTLVEGHCSLDLTSRSTTTSTSTSVFHEIPLYRALDLGKADIAEVLLRHGADPYLECPHDTTLLNKACQRRMTSFVDLLMESGHRWRQESWLRSDFNPTCIANRNLGRYFAAEVPKGVPMLFWNRMELYRRILAVLETPFTLQQCCRVVVRDAIGGRRLLRSIEEMRLPKRLTDFLMLR